MTGQVEASELREWDEIDLEAFASLRQVGPSRYRNIYSDGNLNERVYGGQLLCHTLMAAALSSTDERVPTNLNVLFLRGSDPRRPIDFHVEVLQEGRRFSSRRVVGVQEGRGPVVEAQATFSVAIIGPGHSVLSDPNGGDPDALPDVRILPNDLMHHLRAFTSYSPTIKPCIEFRVPDLESQVTKRDLPATFDYWQRVRKPLGKSVQTHCVAFTYLADWWANFASLVLHGDIQADEEAMYISTLNHSIWFHRAFSANEWMSFRTMSPHAADGRGLTIAAVYDLAGEKIATMTQETLMAPRGGLI